MADERARALRRAPTEGERILWQLLRKRQIAGHRFRRQVRIGPFIADFACLERRVIVEVDGSSHEPSAVNETSRAISGWTRTASAFFRLADSEVLEDQEAAIARICKFLGVDLQADCTTPTQASPVKGEGARLWA